MNVQGGGSTAGIEAALSGTADIGMSSRDLKDNEIAAGLAAHPIAHDAIAIVVHLSNPVAGLSSDQVRRIFPETSGPGRGRWHGHADRHSSRARRVQALAAHSRTCWMEKQRITDRALRQDSNGAVRAIVASDPAAIGYMSLGIVGGVVKAVALDGVAPTVQAALTGEYKSGAAVPLRAQGRARPAARALHRLRALARSAGDPGREGLGPRGRRLGVLHGSG